MKSNEKARGNCEEFLVPKYYKTFYKSVKLGSIILLMHLSFICVPLIVHATSYMPFFHSQDKEGTAMKSGQEVYLFHSGTDSVRKTVQVGDILIVYRITPTCEVKEVGRIKALAFIGENYLKAKVVEGEIKPDDIAKKGNVSCLVISTGVCKE
jgi:hypothetical protein